MTATPRISVCICTRNRPDDLAKAVRSVMASRLPAHEIIVSDDSSGDDTRALVATRFPDVVFVEGPRKGLGANRNRALSAATGTHIAFIDDDVEMDPDFISHVTELARHSDALTIISGVEIVNGRTVNPENITFLGHQRIKYAPGAQRETIVINATAFPAELFQKISFDPLLVYGSDEIDLTTRALTLHGYHIVFDERLRNNHYPSIANRDYYYSFVEASRLYVMFKKYFLVERNILKGMAFVATAYPHILLHYIKRDGFAGLPRFGRTVAVSFGYIGACLKNRAAHV